MLDLENFQHTAWYIYLEIGVMCMCCVTFFDLMHDHAVDSVNSAARSSAIHNTCLSTCLFYVSWALMSLEVSGRRFWFPSTWAIHCTFMFCTFHRVVL